MAGAAKLILFDIDGTLIDTRGAGMAALQTVMEQRFQNSLESVSLEVAGATDSSIVREILVQWEIAPQDTLIEEVFAIYLELLPKNLAARDGKVLSGVSNLLENLYSREDIALGLLTGNISRGAAAKLQHFSLHHYFSIGAYGDDHSDRNSLGPIALERARRYWKQEFDEIFVVGDTPRDIACARAFGATAVAVATGKYSMAELESHQPDILLENLAEDWSI